jgi:hypothetical protein
LPAGLEYVEAPAWKPEAEPLPTSAANDPADAGRLVSNVHWATVAACADNAPKEKHTAKPTKERRMNFVILDSPKNKKQFNAANLSWRA